MDPRRPLDVARATVHQGMQRVTHARERRREARALKHLRAATPRPPGPEGVPVLGVLPLFATDPLGALERCVEEFGDVAHAQVADTHVLVLAHPDLIEQVLMRSQAQFIKDPITRKLSIMLGNGLLTNDGDSWKRQRRLCAPPLRRKQIASYADTMVDCAARHTAKIARSDERDVHAMMMELTLDIVAETLFGANLDNGAGRSVGHNLEIMLEAFKGDVRSWRRLLPPWITTPNQRRAQQAAAQIDVVLYDMIRQTRERNDPDADHLLARLLMARDDEGSSMDDQQVRDEAATMFVAGHETTALTLSFALHALAQQPDLLARVVAEIDGVLGGRRATVDDLARLPLTRATIDESLRLYPPAWSISREATEVVELDGVTVLPGDQCIMPIWVVQRDPRWFPEPLRFNPDRWLDGSTDDLPRFAYFPFGGGARICIGNHFAIMEAVLVLATFLQDVRVHAIPGQTLSLRPSVTLRAEGGVHLHLAPRQPHDDAAPSSPSAEASTRATNATSA